LFTTGKPVSDSAIYARIKRQEAKKRQEVKDEAVELEHAEAAATFSSMSSHLSPPPPSLASKITSVTPGTVGTHNKRATRKRKSPSEGTQNTIVSSKAAAIEMLPGWMNQKATSKIILSSLFNILLSIKHILSVCTDIIDLG
jgi:hypothetical protein